VAPMELFKNLIPQLMKVLITLQKKEQKISVLIKYSKSLLPPL
jgi:hypothetical protein